MMQLRKPKDEPVPAIFHRVPLIIPMKVLTLAFGFGMSFVKMWGQYVDPEYQARVRRRWRRRGKR